MPAQGIVSSPPEEPPVKDLSPMPAQGKEVSPLVELLMEIYALKDLPLPNQQ